MELQNEVDLSNDFTTHQTESMFVLTSDLKKGGYGRKDIKIEINEDGSRMTISGEKPSVQFHKTFIIPEGVVLDKVKARYDQDQSRLTIRMPKFVKGLVDGIAIQEFKPEETKADRQPENNYSSTAPIIAGSTLLVSLILVFFSFVRSKNQSTKRRN